MRKGDFCGGDGAAKARFVGKIIGQLHLVLSQIEAPVKDANLYESAKNWTLPKVSGSLSLSGTFCRSFLRDSGDLHDKLPGQLMHRRPHPSNIIVSPESWGLVGFELSQRNVRIHEPFYVAFAILREGSDENDRKDCPDGWKSTATSFGLIAEQ